MESWVDQLKSNDIIYYDDINGVAGQFLPVGTAAMPVNNWFDAQAILNARGKNILKMMPGATLNINTDENFRLIGDGSQQVTISAAATVILDGDVHIGSLANSGILTILGNLISNNGDVSNAALDFDLHGNAELMSGDLTTDAGIFTIYGDVLMPSGNLRNNDVGLIDIRGSVECYEIRTHDTGNITVAGNAKVFNQIINESTAQITIGGTAFVSAQIINNLGGMVSISGDCYVGFNGISNDDVASTLVIAGNLTCAGQLVNTGTLLLNGVNQAFTKTTTIDLNQAAASYTLFTEAYQKSQLKSLVFRCSNGAIAGAVTKISIQTDDATPQVIIPDARGIVANLTNKAQLAWSEGINGPVIIDVGTRIQLTIYGGSAGVSRVCDVVAVYQPIIPSGVLL
jgi:hypothetical protein